MCPPPAPKAHLPGGEGGGGSIFWKTHNIGLASYTIISLRVDLCRQHLWTVLSNAQRDEGPLFAKTPLQQWGIFICSWSWYRRRVLSELVFVVKRLEGGAFAAFTHTHQTNHSQFRRHFEKNSPQIISKYEVKSTTSYVEGIDRSIKLRGANRVIWSVMRRLGNFLYFLLKGHHHKISKNTFWRLLRWL